MEIRGFEWDDKNLGHLILRHPDIEPEEVEEVFISDPPPYIDRKANYGRWRALGTTEYGRYLVIYFEYKGDGIIRPITGKPMDSQEKREYRKKRR